MWHFHNCLSLSKGKSSRHILSPETAYFLFFLNLCQVMLFWELLNLPRANLPAHLPLSTSLCIFSHARKWALQIPVWNHPFHLCSFPVPSLETFHSIITSPFCIFNVSFSNGSFYCNWNTASYSWLKTPSKQPFISIHSLTCLLSFGKKKFSKKFSVLIVFIFSSCLNLLISLSPSLS